MQFNHAQKVDPNKICPSCGYDANAVNSTHCEICSTLLVNRESVRLSKNNKKKNKTPSSNSAVELLFKNQTQDWLNFVRQIPHNPKYEGIKELRKPINLGGLLMVGLGLALWFNFWVFQNPSKISSSPSSKNKVVTNTNTNTNTKSIPKGLFSYGGASFFAPLVSSGLNVAVEETYPGFELRYTKPLNNDFSYANGINMLLDGELSFAFNGRPLTDQEYEKAKLRGIGLQQIPILIDGVVIFGNQNTPVSKLNRHQVEQIFQGQITNWNQIKPGGEDLPIVPVLIDEENFQMLGIDAKRVAESTQYTSNYTQALRQVIATPGAISFASSSLVGNQKLINMLALAEGNSTNYIAPSIDDQPNLPAFKDGSYPLTRRLFLVYRQDETLDHQAGKAYADYLTSPPGQKIGKQSGFVPIY